jgi:gamma-aminobutyric acid type B receptor
MVLQVIALVLAFSIRKVKVKGLDDAKFIGASVYATSIVLAVTIVGTYSLYDVINAFAGLVCSGFLIGTTVILIFVFVPLVSFKRKCYLQNHIPSNCPYF